LITFYIYSTAVKTFNTAVFLY